MANKDTALQIGFNFDEASARRAIKSLEQLTTVMSGIQNTVDATASSINKLNAAFDKLGRSQGAGNMRGAGLLPQPGSMRNVGNNFGSGAPLRLGYNGGSSSQSGSGGSSFGGGGGRGGGGGGGFNTGGGFSPQDFIKNRDLQQKQMNEEEDSIKRLSSFNLALQGLTAVVAGAAAVFGIGAKVIQAGNESAGTTISANMSARATNFSLDQILGLQFGLKAAGADEGAYSTLTKMTRSLLMEDTGSGAVEGQKYGAIVAGLQKSSAAGIPDAITAIEDAILGGDQGKIVETLLQSLVLAGDDPNVNAGAIAESMGLGSLAGLSNEQFKTIMQYFTQGYGADVGGSQDLRKAMTETEVIVFNALQANVDTMATIVEEVNKILKLLSPALGDFLDGMLLAIEAMTNPKEGIKKLLEWSWDNSWLKQGIDEVKKDDRSVDDIKNAHLFSKITGFGMEQYDTLDADSKATFEGLLTNRGTLDTDFQKEYLRQTGSHVIGGGLKKQFEARTASQGLEVFIENMDIIGGEILGE